MKRLEETFKRAYNVLKGEKSWEQLKQLEQDMESIKRIRTAYLDALEGMRNAEIESFEPARFSRVDDKRTLEFLNSQKTEKVYRAMQVIDGELYPPMAAKVKGEDGKTSLVIPSKLGTWEQADERPDLIKDGKFTLNKENGSSIAAAYNPYFHTSRSALNDQFSSAYKRENLVVVEGEVPSSELTSGYRAEFAKDPVGEMKWHSGPVSSKLKGEKSRRVIFSRWFKPTRIVPDSEVAEVVADLLKDENIEVPAKVVPPSLAEELVKHGVNVTGLRFSKQDSANVDDYTETQYNKYGWARVNGVISARENAAFKARLSDKKNGIKFPKTADGKYLFAVGDEFGINSTIIISNGNYLSPSVDRVYRIALEHETNIEIVRDEIYEKERRAGSRALQIVAHYFGEEFVRVYRLDDCPSYFQLRSAQGSQNSRGDGTASVRNRENEQNGGRNRQKGKENYGIRFSTKDSNGNTLSAGQLAYFKDSKARDEDGNLLVMYHGTPEYDRFTKFKKGKSGWLDPGIYFMSRKSDAERYAEKMGPGGNMYTVYVKLTNPLVVTQSNPVPEILLAAYGKESVYKKRSAEQGNDPSIITNADIKKLVAKGYDGILWQFGKTTELSAFYSNQAKYADNLNPTDNPDIRFSIKEGMTDEERYAELKNAKLTVFGYDLDVSKLTRTEVEWLEKATRRDARMYVKKLYNKFGFDQASPYTNENIGIEFEFSRNDFEESVSQQTARTADYASFCKMLLCFAEIVENAVPIEVHTDKYAGTRREDGNLLRTFALVSAFSDEGLVTPVQLEVKEYKSGANQLYVAVTLNKIKAEVFAPGSTPEGAHPEAVPSFTMSLQELFADVNPVDGGFLKYVPDGFLNEQQKEAKISALEKEAQKIAGYREHTRPLLSLKDTSTTDVASIKSQNKKLTEALEVARAQTKLSKGKHLKHIQMSNEQSR